MGRQAERTMQTRQKLIDAFWKLYCDNKIEKITVKMITDEAGFYRSTFYEYFVDVYDVLDEIENKILDDYRVYFGKICIMNSLEDVQRLGIEFCMAHSEYLAVLLGPDGDRKFYYAVKDLVIKTIRRKFNVDTDDKRIDIFFEVFSSSALAVLNYWYQNQDSITMEEAFVTGSRVIQKGAVDLLKEYDIPFLK